MPVKIFLYIFLINGSKNFALSVNFKSMFIDIFVPTSFFSKVILTVVPFAGPEIICVSN